METMILFLMAMLAGYVLRYYRELDRKEKEL